MSAIAKIVVVGASLAGLRAVEFLRRAKFDGGVTLLGAEAHAPYDRPPLSKELLRGEWDEARVALQRKSFEDLDVEVSFGRRAVALDTERREVHLGDGRAVSYEGLVIATGGVARRLPNQPALPGIHTLRTLDDALALRKDLQVSRRVAVVGAGFIGAEVAASARQLGLGVTMIEALQTPLESSLGTELGTMVRRLHEQRGVNVLCGRKVVGFDGRDRVCGIRLDDGTQVDCDVVVVGIGMTPSTGWLAGSGVALDDGVRCESTLATNVPHVVAAGDVASWYNPLFEERMRVEHWTNAVEQARHAVRTLLSDPGDAEPFSSVPLFWSDQFDVKIQGVGRPRPTDEVVVHRGSEGERLIALYVREGRLTGAVTFNRPPALIQLRMLLAKRGSLEDALKIAESHG